MGEKVLELERSRRRKPQLILGIGLLPLTSKSQKPQMFQKPSAMSQ